VQVFANILSNAAKCTPQAGHITVALDGDADKVRVRVTDDGSGIASTLLPYVFDLFAQGERTPDRSQGGLGLGLSLVKQITALHGGEATAESGGLGEGSTFTIALPRGAMSGDPELVTEPSDRTAQAAGSLNVMIVDDNIDAARSLAELLRASSHQVSVVEDAQSALSSKDKDHTQLFVLDIGLPGMDGYELARQLRSDPATANSTLVALTGYGQAHDRVLSKAAGFDHHLVKPADMAYVEEIIKKIERQRRS
jgi:CheY-like chemotaxis protein